MAHVQIKVLADGQFERFEIDGVDMLHNTLAHGFGVTFGGFPDPAQVTMTVAADVLDIDLPSAVVNAIRQSEDNTSDSAVGDES